MTLPEFQTDGLLPAGIHEATLDELEARLTFTPVRQELLSNLRQCLSDLPYKESIRYVLVDGSFVEDKPDPRDTDVVVVVNDLADGGGGQQLLSWISDRKLTLKNAYGCDIYCCDEPLVGHYWEGLFGHTRDMQEKGLVKLQELPAHDD